MPDHHRQPRAPHPDSSDHPDLAKPFPSRRPLVRAPSPSPLYPSEPKRRRRNTDRPALPTHTPPESSSPAHAPRTAAHKRTLSSTSSIASTMPAYQSRSDPAMTPAERAREKSLLDDPLAVVIDPSHVECKRCKKTIKLSSKSAYDTFHWRNHRARCLKTSKKKGRVPKPRSLDLRKEPSPSLSTDGNAASPAGSDGRGLQTPPLMSDSDDGGHASDRVTELSSPIAPSYPPLPPHPPASPSSASSLRFHHPAGVPAPTTSPVIRQSDSNAVDDYMTRLHPEVVKTCSPHSADVGWQNWQYSQLKQPQFVRTPLGKRVPPVSGYEDDEDDDDDDANDDDDQGDSQRRFHKGTEGREAGRRGRVEVDEGRNSRVLHRRDLPDHPLGRPSAAPGVLGVVPVPTIIAPPLPVNSARGGSGAPPSPSRPRLDSFRRHNALAGPDLEELEAANALSALAGVPFG